MLRIASAVLISLALLAPPLWAQPAPKEGEAEPAAPSLVDKLDAEHKNLLELEGKLTSETGDNRAAIEEEVEDQRDVVHELLEQLVAEVEKTKDAPPADLVKRGTSILRSEIGAVTRELKTLGRLLRKIRSKPESDPQEELVRQERLATADSQYDRLLTRHAASIDLLDRLGADTKTEAKQLAKLLEDRADDAQSLYKLALSQESALKQQAAPTTDDDKAARTKSEQAVAAKVEGAKKSLEKILDLMESRDMDVKDRRLFLIDASGEITTDVFDKDVAAGLAQRWIDKGKTWVVENGPRLAFKVIIFILILLVFRLLAAITRRMIRRALSSSRVTLSKLLKEFFEGLGAKLVTLLGLLIALSQIGIELGPLLAGLGVAGFVLGFALQSTLSNFASGLMILAYRPFDVGDLVEVAGAMGKVSEMTLVSTTVLTLDHQRLVVPNNKVWGEVIRNVTAEPIRRVNLVFGIGYSDDIEKARKVLSEILDSHDQVLDDPEPMVKLHNLGDSSVDFVARPWCKTDDYWDVHWDVTRTVKERFDAEGISIPFPQRDVHIHGNNPA